MKEILLIGETVDTGYPTGCNEDINNAPCLYGRGECCVGNKYPKHDGICQEYNNNPACQFDGGDCLECLNPDLIGNSHCNRENLNIITSNDN